MTPDDRLRAALRSADHLQSWIDNALAELRDPHPWVPLAAGVLYDGRKGEVYELADGERIAGSVIPFGARFSLVLDGLTQGEVERLLRALKLGAVADHYLSRALAEGSDAE